MATILAKLGTRWDPHGPPSSNALAHSETAIGRRLPARLRELYSLVDGGMVEPVEIFTLAELRDVNRSLRERWPGLVFFAGDGADGFFAVDVDGSLIERGSVLWLDRSSIQREEAVPCADGVPELLERVARGEEPWRGPSLAEAARQRAFDALDRFADRWTSRGAGKDPADLLRTKRRVGVRLPSPLSELLQRTDGLFIERAGVTLYAADRIEPVNLLDDDGFPCALWIGEDQKGRRYAVTIIGFRAPEEGWVVRVEPGGDVATAPLLGSLYGVLRKWIDGDDPEPVPGASSPT
ncbi:MAG TPA: SMI1/KNR4 family protein [Polyangiaceae bacterium]